MEMHEKQQLQFDIEEIRRRAKDNKAENGKYYATHAFESLTQLRNLLLALTTAGIAFFQTLPESSSKLNLLIASFIVGIVSYICFYLAMMAEANYYSVIEKMFSTTNISISEYNDAINKEQKAKDNFRNPWYLVSFLCLLLQAVLIVIFFINTA